MGQSLKFRLKHFTINHKLQQQTPNQNTRNYNQNLVNNGVDQQTIQQQVLIGEKKNIHQDRIQALNLPFKLQQQSYQNNQYKNINNIQPQSGTQSLDRLQKPSPTEEMKYFYNQNNFMNKNSRFNTNFTQDGLQKPHQQSFDLLINSSQNQKQKAILYIQPVKYELNQNLNTDSERLDTFHKDLNEGISSLSIKNRANQRISLSSKQNSTQSRKAKQIEFEQSFEELELSGISIRKGIDVKINKKSKNVKLMVDKETDSKESTLNGEATINHLSSPMFKEKMKQNDIQNGISIIDDQVNYNSNIHENSNLNRENKHHKKESIDSITILNETQKSINNFDLLYNKPQNQAQQQDLENSIDNKGQQTSYPYSNNVFIFNIQVSQNINSKSNQKQGKDGPKSQKYFQGQNRRQHQQRHTSHIKRNSRNAKSVNKSQQNTNNFSAQNTNNSYENTSGIFQNQKLTNSHVDLQIKASNKLVKETYFQSIEGGFNKIGQRINNQDLKINYKKVKFQQQQQ
eukprot:403371764